MGDGGEGVTREALPRVTAAEQIPSGLELALEGAGGRSPGGPASGAGPRVRVSAEGDGILRLRLSPRGSFPQPLPDLVPGLEGGLQEGSIPGEREVALTQGAARLATPLLEAGVSWDPLRLAFRPAGGPVDADAQGAGLAAGAVTAGLFWDTTGACGAHLELGAGEAVYGLGEKVGGLDRRGRRYTFWNTDVTPHLPDTDPLYVSVPFWMSLRPAGGGTVATGWFVLAPGRSTVDVGAARADRLTVTVEQGGLDLFVIAGPTPAEVLCRFTRLVGRMPLPPLWALGHQHSRWGHGSAENLLACAREFRRRKIPCDAVYLDIDHMDGFRVFTWDPERFSDPEGLSRELGGLGFRLVTIVDPGVKVDPDYALYRDGQAAGHFVTQPGGGPYHGDVWPGRCAFPDFLRPETRAWWGSWVRRHAARGVAGIWNDMNEPAVFDPAQGKTFPPGVVHRADDGSERSHAEVHNLYGQMMARATWQALAGGESSGAEDGPRPFVLTRSGFAGVQRYGAVWTGDNSSTWEHLTWMIPMLAGLGLSGVPFAGVDVGGFGGDVEGELFARWVQAAALAPLFRNHSAFDTRRQEPWMFGPEVEEVARRAVALRYRLLPYLYAVFEEAHRTGAPILRPLVYAYPDDPRAREVADAYLVGADLLVAPILEPGAARRPAYLPPGRG